ncbi:TonB-dependent receptor [Sphingomonas sp. AR_OL41]|uniref:TonB-dependent receptor n=1 Tax=Sphingomonas sp. AR_OL41 TaxID=3042729 RepID=UPI002480F33B|nr:TonB-dependent receptor [Sphingomonas sp. AR_OL41]MDH7973340.1 TonB-dependent receptor [Sphingomonas sp. AR_OL41]
MSSRFPSPSLRALSIGASLMVLAIAAPAQARAAQAAPDQSPALDSDDGVIDIVVTALRGRDANKDVPVAVTAIGGEKLDVINASGLDIRFLSSRTPSLQVESSFGRTFPRFYIRGLGNTDFDPNAAQPVSVVYDDVALESPMLKSFPAFDLASVEVLRGPQGTLFGRNTPAGVVKLNSARPSDAWKGYASVSLATYDTVNAEAAVGGPLGGGFSFRASGILQYRDDWVTNTTTAKGADKKLEGYRDLAGRFQLAYASGDFNALLSAHVRDLTGSPRVFRAGLFQKGSNNFSAGFDPARVSLDGYTSQALTQWGTNLHLDYHMDGLGTLYSITGYEKAKVESTGDIDGGNNYVFPALGLNNALFPSNTGGVTRPEEFSQELRFASDMFGGFSFQAGAYYFHQKLQYHEYNYVFPTTGSRTADNNQDIFHDNRNENYGIFASLAFKPVEELTLRAGARYSHDSKHDRVSGFSPNLFGYVLPVEARVSAGNVSWDVSATYAVSPQVNVYARAATGYLGPAIQDRVTFGSRQTTAAKETTISGEIGIKGGLADRTLSFALDAYWNRTKNLQITAVGGATNSARLLNADHAIGYGVEAEVEARPVPQLLLTASASYNFTEIRDKNISVGVCGALCTVVDPLNAAGNAIIDGNPLPQAPRYVANVTARYSVPVANGNEVYLYTDWACRSTINYFLYDALEFRGRPLLEGGLKLGFKMTNGLDVALFARNITNQIRSISAIDFNNLTGMINEPRIIGAQAKFTF